MSASEARLANIYEDEYKNIQALGWVIQTHWNEVARTINIANVKETAKKMNEFASWAEGKFEGIGFIALIDTTPIYADRPPVITLMDRIDSEGEFDHEKKAEQIRKEMH